MRTRATEKNEGKRFKLGEVVALRYRRNRPADVVLPAWVMDDRASYVALYIMPGTVLKGPATAHGSGAGIDDQRLGGCHV